jgi:hypothetical protein
MPIDTLKSLLFRLVSNAKLDFSAVMGLGRRPGNSLEVIQELQVTSSWSLARQKPYSEFESISLRHTVPLPENSPHIRAKIHENGRNFRDFALKPDQR